MSEKSSNISPSRNADQTTATRRAEPKAADQPAEHRHITGFWQELRALVENRSKVTLKYVIRYIQILVLWSCALITDYMLLLLLEWTLQGDIARYPDTVGKWFTYAKIGLGALTIIAAVVHGGISTWELIKLDLEPLEDGEQK